MIQYKGIAHNSLLVSRLEDSLVFYCDILGMTLDPSRPDLGYPGAWLNIGKQQIHLLQLESPDSIVNRPEHGGRDRHTAILINGFNELKEMLVRANIDITLSKSGRRAIFCRDPDGNALEFISTE
ncbi:MAG: VOC family protein [Acidiferrobacterales bacterium]